MRNTITTIVQIVGIALGGVGIGGMLSFATGDIPLIGLKVVGAFMLLFAAIAFALIIAILLLSFLGRLPGVLVARLAGEQVKT